MEHSFETQRSIAGTEGVLILKGDITISAVSELKEVLTEAIAETEILTVDLSMVESADVSFLQILCALHRECFSQGKQVCISEEMPHGLKEMISRAGYTKQLGCPHGAKQSCLWAECALS